MWCVLQQMLLNLSELLEETITEPYWLQDIPQKEMKKIEEIIEDNKLNVNIVNEVEIELKKMNFYQHYTFTTEDMKHLVEWYFLRGQNIVTQVVGGSQTCETMLK